MKRHKQRNKHTDIQRNKQKTNIQKHVKKQTTNIQKTCKETKIQTYKHTLSKQKHIKGNKQIPKNTTRVDKEKKKQNCNKHYKNMYHKLTHTRA